MAEGFANALGWESFSAGTSPEFAVNPNAVKVMEEKNISLVNHTPEIVDKYIEESFDIVMTVCDNAKENCPVFLGTTKKLIHHSFEDPANFVGDSESTLNEFRKIRDQIEEYLNNLL
jgi:arsenate reductase